MRVWLRADSTKVGTTLELDGDEISVLMDSNPVTMPTDELMVPVASSSNDDSRPKVEWVSLSDALLYKLVVVDGTGELSNVSYPAAN